MAKSISCRHAGVAQAIMGQEFDCDWQGEAPSEEELLKAVEEHNRIAHRIDKRLEENDAARIRAAMHEAA